MADSSKRVVLCEAELADFIKALDTCSGRVFLVTDEGDKINMKSQLCRMIGIHHVIAGGTFSGGKLECENTEDANRLFRFNLYGTTETK